MEPVFRCLYDQQPCHAALVRYLCAGDIDAVNEKGHTLLGIAIHVYLTYRGSAPSLKNVDLLLRHGANPHAHGVYQIAVSFGNGFSLVKLLMGAPKFNPAQMRTNSMKWEMNFYLNEMDMRYKAAVRTGLPYVLATLVPRPCWPLPGILLKALTPADRAQLKLLAEDQISAPRGVRAAFFNKQSSAERLPTVVAQLVSVFVLRPAAERGTLREYARLLNL